MSASSLRAGDSASAAAISKLGEGIGAVGCT